MADKFAGTLDVAVTVASDATFVGTQTEAGALKAKRFTKDQVAALSGGGATTTMNGVQPNTPAVNANQSYTVVNNAPFAVGQYLALSGITGVFQVVSLSGSTILELKNINAPVNAAIATGVKVVPSGPPGPQGAASIVPGPKGDAGTNGQNAFTTTTGFTAPSNTTPFSITVASGTPFNAGDRVAIAGNYFTVTATAATTLTITNTITAQNGAVIANGAKVQVVQPGNVGSAGPAGVNDGIRYTYNTTAGAGRITATAPTSATLANATTLAINATDATTPTAKDASNVLARLKTGTIIQVEKDDSNWVRYNVTADYAAGAVTVTVDQSSGTIASGDTVYLLIVATPVSAAGGGGITWTEYTAASNNVPTKSGAIANRPTAIELVFPAGVKGDPLSVQRAGTGQMLLTGQTFKFPDGSTNSGVRSLAGFPLAAGDFLCLEPGVWVARNQVGLELYNYNASLLTGFFISGWNLNETTGNRNDVIGTNHLIPVNTVPTATAGLIGNAATFNGDGTATTINQGALSIASNASLVAGANTPIFITAAVRITAKGAANSLAIIASKYGNYSAPREWALYYERNSDQFAFDVYDTGTTFYQVKTALASVALNTWYILMAWFDPTADKIYISVNNSTPNELAVPAAYSIPSSTPAVPFNVGAEPEGGASGSISTSWVYGLNGQVDCLGFGKTVPTPAQRTAIYNGGLGITFP